MASIKTHLVVIVSVEKTGNIYLLVHLMNARNLFKMPIIRILKVKYTGRNLKFLTLQHFWSA